jgi:excisionase family DNA binding protein
LETARDLFSQSSEVEFENLFVSDSEADRQRTDTDANTDTIEVSVPEAAKLLGITERTIWRRIRQKKLASELVNGKTVIRLSRTDIRASASDNVTDDFGIEAQPVSDTEEPISQSDTVNTALTELVSELSAKLEAATYRAGYLEAVVNSQSKEIRLLPDLQEQARQKAKLEEELSALKERADKVSELETALMEKERELSQVKNSWWAKFGRMFSK